MQTSFSVVLALVLAACSATNPVEPNDPAGDVQGDIVVNEQTSGDGTAGNPDESGDKIVGQVGGDSESAPEVESSEDGDLERVETCYEEGIHPIGLSIAEQFEDITSYKEVMSWFCQGAEFEDILNALMAEELSGADGESLLLMIASGKTWDEIWLELGITD
jgi:hypothetical protein